MSGKYKFLAAVIGLFLLPFLIISGHFIYGNTALRKNDMLRYFEMRTLAGARIIANEMNANYNLTRLTGDKKFREAGAVGRKAAMERRTKETPFIYSELALVSASGSEVCRVSAGKDGKPAIDYAKSPVFLEARRTAGPAGAVEYGDYTPPALILAQPLEVARGTPDYYLAGRLSLAYIGEVVRLLGKNSLGNFGLLDGGGQLIADSMNMSTVRPGIQAPQEILTLVAAAQERAIQNFTREVFFKQRASLVSVSNVPGTKWWLYEIMDSKDIPSRGFSGAGRVVFSGILLIVFFGFVTYVLALRWLLPGREVTKAEADEE